ncbi:hypothetical protein Tco_0289885 [Tanacetum coccineum]
MEDARVDVILDFLKRNDFARAGEALPIEMDFGVSKLRLIDLFKWRIHMRKAFSPKKEICIPEDVEHESNADEDEDGQVSICLTCIRHSVDEVSAQTMGGNVHDALGDAIGPSSEKLINTLDSEKAAAKAIEED